MERDVEPVYKKSQFEMRPFGSHMDVDSLMAKQTRIERQEEPKAASVSFDRNAANVFQVGAVEQSPVLQGANM